MSEKNRNLWLTDEEVKAFLTAMEKRHAHKSKRFFSSLNDMEYVGKESVSDNQPFIPKASYPIDHYKTVVETARSSNEKAQDPPPPAREISSNDSTSKSKIRKPQKGSAIYRLQKFQQQVRMSTPDPIPQPPDIIELTLALAGIRGRKIDMGVPWLGGIPQIGHYWGAFGITPKKKKLKPAIVSRTPSQESDRGPFGMFPISPESSVLNMLEKAKEEEEEEKEEEIKEDDERDFRPSPMGIACKSYLLDMVTGPNFQDKMPSFKEPSDSHMPHRSKLVGSLRSLNRTNHGKHPFTPLMADHHPVQGGMPSEDGGYSTGGGKKTVRFQIPGESQLQLANPKNGVSKLKPQKVKEHGFSIPTKEHFTNTLLRPEPEPPKWKIIKPKPPTIQPLFKKGEQLTHGSSAWVLTAPIINSRPQTAPQLSPTPHFFKKHLEAKKSEGHIAPSKTEDSSKPGTSRSSSKSANPHEKISAKVNSGLAELKKEPKSIVYRENSRIWTNPQAYVRQLMNSSRNAVKPLSEERRRELMSGGPRRVATPPPTPIAYQVEFILNPIFSTENSQSTDLLPSGIHPSENIGPGRPRTVAFGRTTRK